MASDGSVSGAHVPGRTVAFARTIAVEQFGASTPLPAATDGESAPPRVEPPTLPGVSLAERLRRRGSRCAAAGEAGASRFDVVAVLGAGASGQVLAVRDRDLQRDLALKIVHAGDEEAVDRFIDEARTMASLDHPNVPPVHEIDLAADGAPFFLVKRIDGRSLGDAIATAGAAPSPDLEPNRLVAMAIAVAHALAYAHHHGVVHQDLKPDNIMLGRFGEVLLVDWGSAARIAEPEQRLYGTPLYMAPEQARRERVDARTDLYCLGATLFHALTRRMPTWSDDAEEFWRLKRAGLVAPPTAAERAAAPPALLDIALKAMAPRAQDRYQTAEALIEDLRAYQAGLAVSAHGDTLLERVARWHRQHARAFWSAAAAATVIGALVLALFGERLKDIAAWGRPVIAESFADDSWRERWALVEGSYERVDGSLADRSAGGSTLRCLQPLPDDAAIEFTGWIEPGTLVGDLSVLWSQGPDADDGPHWSLQFGAQGGACSRIIAPDAHIVAMSTTVPQPGRRYQVRVEVVERTLRMLVDGREIMSYVDERWRLAGGRFSIYTFYVGKHIADVRVYARGVPERVPVTAAADLCAQHGLGAVAESEYERIAASHPGSELADEALFELGACRQERGDAAGREAAWSAIARGAWRDRAEAGRADGDFAVGNLAGGLARLEALARRTDASQRQALAVRWNGQAHSAAIGAIGRAHLEPAERCLATWRRCFADQPVTAQQASEALDAIGRFDEAMATAVGCPDMLINSANDAGRPEAALEHLTDPSMRRNALLLMGEPQQVLAFSGLDDEDAMVAAGRGEEFIARKPRHLGVSLIASGRPEELFADPFVGLRRQARLLADQVETLPPADRDEGPPLLMALGRYDDVLARFGDDARWGMWPRQWFALDAWIAGDRAQARARFAIPDGWLYRQSACVAGHYSIEPLLRESDGERGVFESLRAELATHRYAYRQVPWYLARYVLGEIDDAGFRARPLKRCLEADLAWASAIKADRAGDAARAAAAYAAWLATPRWAREVWPDPVTERFARWRIAQLTR